MTFTEIMEIIRAISLIAVLVFSIALAAYALIKASREKGFTRRRLAQVILALGALFITYLTYNVREIAPADWAQIMLTLGLVAVTGFYALSASRQADASVEMAKEMREQRYDAVRPVIDIYRDQAMEDKMPEALEGTMGDASRGLSCILKNIGLGPAIDVYSFIQNPFSGERQRFEFGTLAIGEMTSRMKLSLIDEDNPLALVAYYRDVYGRAFVSKREVSTDKKKGWQIGPLQTHPATYEEHL